MPTRLADGLEFGSTLLSNSLISPQRMSKHSLDGSPAPLLMDSAKDFINLKPRIFNTVKLGLLI